jgi:foldase protein PrsA
MRRFGKILGWGGLAILGWIGGQVYSHCCAQNSRPATSPAEYEKNVVAYVNGVPITRQELGEELIARKGKEQLKLLINRKIIEQACQKAGVSVTDAEVEADLKDVMRTANAATPAQFEESILKRRNTTLIEYKEDVVRPGIAMRKLAGKQVEVTDEEIRRAYESNYGEKVKCRIIMIPESDARLAPKIFAQVRDDREAFLRQALQQADPNLAACGGEIKIGRFTGLDSVEEAAFALKDGQVSQVLQVEGGRVILLREGLEPRDESTTLEQVRDELRHSLLEKKLRAEVPRVFHQLREEAVIRDFLNNKFDIKEVMNELYKKTPPGPASAGATRDK